MPQAEWSVKGNVSQRAKMFFMVIQRLNYEDSSAILQDT